MIVLLWILRNNYSSSKKACLSNYRHQVTSACKLYLSIISPLFQKRSSIYFNRFHKETFSGLPFMGWLTVHYSMSDTFRIKEVSYYPKVINTENEMLTSVSKDTGKPPTNAHSLPNTKVASSSFHPASFQGSCCYRKANPIPSRDLTQA